ncbi:MAG: hypothetical protein ACOYL3_22545 [Desulfuromonadaceae bacterium]
MAKRLPSVDAFSAMLERGFPAGPLSDPKVGVEVEPSNIPAIESALPTPPVKPKKKADDAFNNYFSEERQEEPIERAASDFTATSPTPTVSTNDEPAKQPANEPATQPDKELANHVANEPAYKPVNSPDHIQANEPVKKPDSKPAIYADQAGYPDSEPGKYPVDPVNKPVTYEANEPDIKPVIKSDIEPVNNPAMRPVNQLANNIDPELWYPYTEKQGRILLYLIEANGRTKRAQIVQDTGINIATVKYALRMFVKEQFISQTVLDVKHTDRGFSYSLNPHKCHEYASRFFGKDYSINYHPANEPVRYPVNRPVVNPVVNPVVKPEVKPEFPFSSSSSKEYSTTTENQDLFETDPELRYWRDRGVSMNKVISWTTPDQCDCSADKIIKSLRHGRYDFEIENMATKKNIDNPLNWFYSVLKKSKGDYSAANYKSYELMRLEKLEKEAKELADIRKRLAAAEREVAFERILSDTDGEKYKALYAKLDNSFAKEEGGEILIGALRDLFFGQ